jgi:hypothetical protein
MNIFKIIFDLINEYDFLIEEEKKIILPNIIDLNNKEYEMNYEENNINHEETKTSYEIDIVENNELNNELNKKLNQEYKKIKNTKIFIKKLYKKLVLKCHPDKNGNDKIFIKCKEYYETNFLIGLLYICELINSDLLPELNEIILKEIFSEIKIIQEKINIIKKKLNI